MSSQEHFHIRRSLVWAIAISLILHGIVLFVPQREPKPASRPLPRLEASLAPQPNVPPLTAVPQPARRAETAPARTQAKKRVLALNKSNAASTAAPKWSVAQKEEMNKFLDGLGDPAKPRPSLAERSLAMARNYGRQQAERDEEEGVSLERLPDSPPVDPFSLEMYLDSLVKKLNRSAAYVRNDPRAKGMKTASIQIRLNPNGSLKSFRVLNAGDQQDEIAFVKSVVEKAVPFAPFPNDMRRSAQSLAMIICIMPPSWSGGFGFSRVPEGHGC